MALTSDNETWLIEMGDVVDSCTMTCLRIDVRAGGRYTLDALEQAVREAFDGFTG